MYFILLAVMASVVLLVAIPIAFIIALMSPQEGTRLAPERNSSLRGFAIVVAIVVTLLLLLATLGLGGL